MSDNPIALLQQSQSQLPVAVRTVMEGMQSSEMQANVGASFAVVSIKGKTFSIKFGGASTMLTMESNGSQFAAQYFDVVIPIAKAELSKTWYKGTYQEGDDAQPDCWAEDGLHPLAPEAQRPIVNGAPCRDCRICPMNQFGSKATETGARGKACSDTRKIIVLPIDSRTNMLDAKNIKFGGAMLLRIPPASLRVLADYDAKLNSMAAAYMGVVTRIEFDPNVAYPKLVFKALRYLTDAEAADVIEVRNSLQVRQILESGQTGAAPSGDHSVAQLTGQMPTALQGPANNVVPIHSAPQPAPVQVQNPPAPTPVAPAPVQTAPAPAPVAPAPVQVAPTPPPPPVQAAPPPPVQFPPAGWVVHPTSPGWYWNQTSNEVVSEADLRARSGPAAPAPAPVAPQPAPVQAAAVAAAPGPDGAVQVTPQMMASVDSMLAGVLPQQ